MNRFIALFFVLSISIYAEESKISYWQVQRKGANFFNKIPVEDWFIAAKAVGIEFARLAPDKWKSKGRDFLLGDADAFEEVSGTDFQVLKNTLDQAYRHNIKIVITLLSLPGSRWKQNNDDRDDLRIWQREDYAIQAAVFWKQLAHLLKDHPAVVGYNILNEPHPERLFGMEDFMEIDFQKWYASVQRSCADLNLFYQKIVKAIREVDTSTPIILDTGLYATPWTMSYLNPSMILESSIRFTCMSRMLTRREKSTRGGMNIQAAYLCDWKMQNKIQITIFSLPIGMKRH